MGNLFSFVRFTVHVMNIVLDAVTPQLHVREKKMRDFFFLAKIFIPKM